MTPNDWLTDIQNFRPFSFMKVQDTIGTAFIESIIRMLKKLGVKPGDVFVYDKRLARLRGLKLSHRDNLLYYGVSYQEYETFDDGFDEFNYIVDGKCCRLWDYWEEPFAFNPDFTNCGMIQCCCVETLGKIYDYLRMELKAPKGKRRFTIETHSEYENRIRPR